MSKFLCLGMPLAGVIAASTVNAATALKRPELGSLKPGCVGDATILSVEHGRFDYVDAVGEHLTGDRKIVADGVVIAGQLVASALSNSTRMPFALNCGIVAYREWPTFPPGPGEHRAVICCRE